MTATCLYGVVIRLVSAVLFYYIRSNDYVFFFIKSTHMKNEETPLTGKTTVTIFLAIAFLALVMCLSYLFITGTR